MNQHEKFIIIGSNSFSGASFIDCILRENTKVEVIGISRSPEYQDCFLPYKGLGDCNFRFMQQDLNKDLDRITEIIREFRPNYIVNFAAQGMVAQSWSCPEQWFQTNCIAILNLANRLLGENYLTRYVQISSPEVYGSCNKVTEDNAKFKPSTPYAASKACGDLSLYPFFFHKGLPVVYTRATNVYGPHQQLYRIVPRTIISIRKGVKIPLQGGGRAVKSYIHIKDVCDATLKIARNGRNGDAYHISPDGEGISIYDLVRIICEKMGVKIENCIEFVGDRVGQDAAYVIDSQKVRDELRWRPTIGLEDGLEGVIEWVNREWDTLKNEPLEYRHKP